MTLLRTVIRRGFIGWGLVGRGFIRRGISTYVKLVIILACLRFRRFRFGRRLNRFRASNRCRGWSCSAHIRSRFSAAGRRRHAPSVSRELLEHLELRREESAEARNELTALMMQPLHIRRQ